MNRRMAGPDYLASAQSLVIKVGSSLLIDEHDQVRRDWLFALAADIAVLTDSSKHVLVVSSGAVALGRAASTFTQRTDSLPEKQAAAAVGQVLVANAWREALAASGLNMAQVLLTLEDTEHRKRYLNARDTLDTLTKNGIVAVINENDTVATDELKYGDNDCLAARVAQMTNSELLVLLSDVDGLYDSNPATHQNAKHIPFIDRITPFMRDAAGDSASTVGTGGMRSKLRAATIATEAGIPVVLGSGLVSSPLEAIRNGAKHSVFAPTTTRRSARRRWIAATLQRRSSVAIDAGALRALLDRKSLLPIGVESIAGDFGRGDCVAITHAGVDVGVGLVRMPSVEAQALSNAAQDGARTDVLIHSDDLVLQKEGVT